MAYRTRTGAAASGVVAFTTSTSGPPREPLRGYTSEPGGVVEVVHSDMAASRRVEGSLLHSSGLCAGVATSSAATTPAPRGSGSASAAAAAFTQSVQRVAARSPTSEASGGVTGGSHAGSLSSTMNSTGPTLAQPVDYKGVLLLPGIEQIQFGDSYYLGTVDTEGRMAGYGKATWESGDEYEGEWLRDRMHGNGVYRWADGDYYRGEYVEGYMNGFGEMKDATGLYIGHWVDDMRQGHGRMLYAGGNVYEGQWLGGMRHGHGKLTEANGTVYEGEFIRNEKEGKGVQTNAEGDVYDGEFVCGKLNGRGTYIWHDGAKYVGYFKDGLKHGEGCEWLPDGSWIAGNFIHGEHDEGQVVRHKAVASDFQAEELPDQLATVLQPLAPAQLQKLSSAAQAAERRVSGGGSGRREVMGGSTAPQGGGASVLSPGERQRRRGGRDGGEASLVAGSSVGGTPGSEGTEGHRDSFSRESPATPFAMALRPAMLSEKDLEGWTQLKIIGKGSFGAVYEALLTSGRTVCCKVIELGNVTECEELEKLKNEIALMRRMHHPNIVQYYGSTEDTEKNTMNIFMELVSGGSLNSFVKKFKTIPMLTMRQWTYQMVCGVKYLHDCGIVHRDIKGDNVLVSLDGIVKLADFGCSKSIDAACSATHGCATMVGTPYWMAPEVIMCESGGYGAKSDIWSIGCTIVEMITGKPPWPECNSMWAAVYKIANSTGLPTEIPKDLDPQLMNLLERCFERDPRKRASAGELLEHPFLAAVANPAAHA